MRYIFVAGTDTDIGKSVVTGLLARRLLDNGHSVVTQKWVGTGCSRASNDIDAHLKFMGKSRGDFRGYLQSMMPHIFKFPSSPHLAARLAKRRIDLARIKGSLKKLSKDFNSVIIEGTGGLLVPLDEKTLLIDVVKSLRLPVILVAPNRLGTINHTLLSIEALRMRKIKIIGIIFNNTSKKENRIVLRDNPKIVEKISGTKVLGILPWLKDIKAGTGLGWNLKQVWDGI